MKTKYILLIGMVFLLVGILFIAGTFFSNSFEESKTTIPIFNTLIKSGEYVEATSYVQIINSDEVYIS